MGGFVLKLGLALFGFAGVLGMSVRCIKVRMEEGTYLIRSISSDATDCRLDCADTRVDVRLESGSVLVRHDCYCLFFSLVWYGLVWFDLLSVS
jgi:hypothetical protein